MCVCVGACLCFDVDAQTVCQRVYAYMYTHCLYMHLLVLSYTKCYMYIYIYSYTYINIYIYSAHVQRVCITYIYMYIQPQFSCARSTRSKKSYWLVGRRPGARHALRTGPTPGPWTTSDWPCRRGQFGQFGPWSLSGSPRGILILHVTMCDMYNIYIWYGWQ